MLRLIACILTLACPLCSSALALDARKTIDFTQILRDPDGQPFTDCLKLDELDRTKCADLKIVTLGWAAMSALNVSEPAMTYTESVKRGELGLKVYKSRGVELNEDEINLIKAQLAKRWAPLLVARAVPLLNAGLK